MSKKRECQTTYVAIHAGRVTYVVDPYASQVYDVNIKMWMCEACIESAALGV
jgi:hypothetical protein